MAKILTDQQTSDKHFPCKSISTLFISKVPAAVSDGGHNIQMMSHSGRILLDCPVTITAGHMTLYCRFIQLKRMNEVISHQFPKII